jgi:hypothetical protein
VWGDLGVNVGTVGIRVIGLIDVLNPEKAFKPKRPRLRLMEMLLKMLVVQVLFLLINFETIFLILYNGIQTQAPLLI